MAERVQFVVISQEDYDNLEKNEYTYYKCYDTENIYLGSQQLNNTDLTDIIIGGTNILNGTNICKEITDGYWENSGWSGGGTGIFSGVENNTGITPLEITDAPNPHISRGWLLDNELDPTQRVNIQQRQIPLKQGETYTMSCYVRGSGMIRLFLTTQDDGYADYELTDSWEHYSFTCTLNSGSIGQPFYAILGTDEGGAEDHAQFCGMKLEIGDIATDWCPSPADLATATEVTNEPLIWGTFSAPAKTNFYEFTPAEIQEIVNAGEAENYWSVGDMTPITLNGDAIYKTYDDEVFYAFIIGFDHNVDIETNGKHSLTLQFGKTADNFDIALGTSQYKPFMNETATSEGGWKSSYMRNTFCPAFYQVLPADWQNVIGTITKYTDNVGDHNETLENISITEDQIFIPSTYEFNGLSSNDYTSNTRPNMYEENYQKQYEYYAIGNSLAKSHENNTAFDGYITRSVDMSSTTSFIELVCLTEEYSIPAAASANLQVCWTPTFTIVEQSSDPSPIFGDNTPEQIKQAVTEGIAADLWSVGDTIAINLNGEVTDAFAFDNETYYAYILGFDHNTNLETNGKHNLTLQFGKIKDGTDICFLDALDLKNWNDGFVMNKSDDEGYWNNNGGWESSHMKNTICPAFFNTLPSEWQNIVGTIIKYTNNTGDHENHIITSQKNQIFLLAEYETFGSIIYAYNEEQNYQQQYSYYAIGNSPIKYSNYEMLDEENKIIRFDADWWLRSPENSDSQNGTGSFCAATWSGTSYPCSAINFLGFAPAFCIVGD